MKTYTCRKCGAPLLPQEDQITAVCQNCGNLLRLPRVDQTLYNRANELRLEKNFDQAAAMFRECLTQDPQDAECHWNLLLCKFGVEYVKDSDGSLIPTCSGITYDSILEDEDYIDAVRFADAISARIYEAEAQRFSVIQQEIIKLAKKGEEFDVFISYKETDANGGRTEDSVLAQKIYEELTKKGYKVFFSRVTLKGQAGLKYEPIIFSALNSAPVMILVGTSTQNMESVWVKNEWTRFLHLMEEDADKKIEIVYKGIDRIHLPARLRFVPQRKISENDKFGWYQDVAYDVDSMLEYRKKIEISVGGFIRESDDEASNREIKNLYIRSEQFLEDGQKEKAKECLASALDIDETRAETWWRLLWIDSDKLTYVENKPEPEGLIKEYAENVRKYALRDQEEWLDEIDAYFTMWKHNYGNLCFEEMEKILESKTSYRLENQQKLYETMKLIQKYAAVQVIEVAEECLKKWEEKLPILEEYHQKTANVGELHETLKKENPDYQKRYEMVEKNNRYFRKVLSKRVCFGVTNIAMLLYLLFGPAWAAFIWKADGADGGPFTGWTAFGSMICLVGYLIGVIISWLLGGTKDNRTKSLGMHAVLPGIGILIGTFIGESNQNDFLRKIAAKFGVKTEWAMGSLTWKSEIALFEAAQPMIRNFCYLLLVLIAVHILLAIRKYRLLDKVERLTKSNEYGVQVLNEKTAEVVAKFHEYYNKELGSDNLNEAKIRSEIYKSNKRYYV